MSELSPPLVNQEFLEILQAVDLMVSGQDGLGRYGFFRADGLFTEQTDGIVGLKGDSPWVDAAVAIGAGRFFAVNFQLVTHGQLLEILHALFDARNVGRRWLGRIVEESFPDPYRPFDGVGVGPIRAGQLNGCMPQYATGSARAFEGNPLETLGLRPFQSVVLS